MRYDELPGPSSYSLPAIFSLATCPIHEVLAAWAAKYGDRVFAPILGRPRIFLNQPALLGQILDTDNECFYKREPVAEMRPMVRQSVFIANGAEWAPKRHGHPFASSWLDPWISTVLPVVRPLFEERLAKVADTKREFVAVTRRLSFDAFCLAVFGRFLDDAHYRAFISMYDDASLRMQLAAVVMPVTVNPFASGLRERWLSRVALLVHGRAQAPAPSLLAWLARHGTSLDESLLVDEVSTILFAGVGPVAVTMASLLYELGRRPKVLNSLRAPARNADSLSALSSGPIAHTVAETLRLWPTVSVLSRAPYLAQVVGDIEVDADIDIFLSPWALHRSSRVWTDPLTFSPERFATELAPWTYLPFGIGPRTCVGQPWALVLLRLFTATIARDWEVDVPQGEEYALKYYSGFARPARELRGRIQRAHTRIHSAASQHVDGPGRPPS